MSPTNVASSIDHERGREIYNFRCYFCHGYSGDAKTLASSYLDPVPRNFLRTAINDLPRTRMLAAVTHGRAGTAMQSFAGILTTGEIVVVIDFVIEEFMRRGALNTRYHTAENGWPDHQRYQLAFPFALGSVALDAPTEQLSADLLMGKRVYMTSCISCHDRGRVDEEGVRWEPRPVSYPRYNQVNVSRRMDALTTATPYAKHDKKPLRTGLSAREVTGEILYQKNCAFCHANDGTGKNWIGQFLQPHPRDLTHPDKIAPLTTRRLRQVIEDGLPGTTMSAWKNVLTDAQINAIIAYITRVFFNAD